LWWSIFLDSATAHFQDEEFRSQFDTSSERFFEREKERREAEAAEGGA
jgi:hypothetical protein